MPLNKNNTKTFYKGLYAGILERVTLLKRDDDQREGVVTSYKLCNCRWSSIEKYGEPIEGDMASVHTRTLTIYRKSLDAIGVNHINVLDRFIDVEGRYWQPESDNHINIKLFQNVIVVNCVMVDPGD